MSQRTFENIRQDGNWLMPTHVEGRNDTRQESQIPPDPLPSRFSDWSSLGSPMQELPLTVFQIEKWNKMETYQIS